MATEYREIVFSLQELGQAIQSYRSVQNPELPVRRPMGIRIESDPEITFHARFEYDEDEESFTALQITAALIRHAKATGVPVARNSRKALSIRKNSVMLQLWID